MKDENMDAPEPSAHRQAWDWIPWVVNGSASEDQRRTVMVHSESCPDCREEFEFQCHLRDGMAAGAGMAAAGTAGPDPDRALQRFFQRLDTAQADSAWEHMGENEAPPPPTIKPEEEPARRRRSGWQRMLVAAVVVQAIGLAGAVGMIWERGGNADYQVLTRPEALPLNSRPASIRLVPAPGLQLGELRALLARSDLQLLRANADASILTLAQGPGARFTQAEAVLRLRAETGVLLAEPIAPGAAP